MRRYPDPIRISSCSGVNTEGQQEEKHGDTKGVSDAHGKESLRVAMIPFAHVLGDQHGDRTDH